MRKSLFTLAILALAWLALVPRPSRSGPAPDDLTGPHPALETEIVTAFPSANEA